MFPFSPVDNASVDIPMGKFVHVYEYLLRQRMCQCALRTSGMHSNVWHLFCQESSWEGAEGSPSGIHVVMVRFEHFPRVLMHEDYPSYPSCYGRSGATRASSLEILLPLQHKAISTLPPPSPPPDTRSVALDLGLWSL